MASFAAYFVLIFSVVSVILADNCNSKKKIVCYYGSWAIYRNQSGKFTTEDINPNLCTHLIYTFAGLDRYGAVTTLDEWTDVTRGGYKNVTTTIKEKNPCLKTILAIGGWNIVSRMYSVVVSTDQGQNALVESIVRFVVNFGFDGIDFDWEYPTQRGGISEDKTNFASLLAKLKTRLEPWGLSLSIAVPLSTELAQKAYDIATIKEYVDFVSLMAYDYTPTTSNTTGLLAPLSAIDSTVSYWLSNGLPPEKLVLGVPAYARSAVLLDPKLNGVGAPVASPGRAGTYTGEPGFLSYYELLSKLSSNRYTIVTNDSTCYAFFAKTWLSFDSKETYTNKVKYALEKNLGGIMVWSVDTDDFLPIFETRYPVLTTIYNVTNGL